MTEKPTVICHMLSSIDGKLHPSRYTTSSQGSVKDWNTAYEDVHKSLAGDAWLIGRVTMAEMAKGEARPPSAQQIVARPVHIAKREAEEYAVAIDRSAKLHFGKPEVGGCHPVIMRASSVSDAHLAELAASGVSYIVSPDEDIALDWALRALRSELGVERLLLEGGGEINGAFFAAGLVDELSVLVAPALDAGHDVQGIVTHGTEGLAGKVQLSLIGCEALGHGLVHLRYAVTS